MALTVAPKPHLVVDTNGLGLLTFQLPQPLLQQLQLQPSYDLKPPLQFNDEYLVPAGDLLHSSKYLSELRNYLAKLEDLKNIKFDLVDKTFPPEVLDHHKDYVVRLEKQMDLLRQPKDVLGSIQRYLRPFAATDATRVEPGLEVSLDNLIIKDKIDTEYFKFKDLLVKLKDEIEPGEKSPSRESPKALRRKSSTTKPSQSGHSRGGGTAPPTLTFVAPPTTGQPSKMTFTDFLVILAIWFLVFAVFFAYSYSFSCPNGHWLPYGCSRWTAGAVSTIAVGICSFPYWRGKIRFARINLMA